MSLHDFNLLGVVALVIIISLCVIMVIITLVKHRVHVGDLYIERKGYKLSSREIEACKNDSISVQPSNTRICDGCSVSDIYFAGAKAMQQDGFNMLKGVDFDNV